MKNIFNKINNFYELICLLIKEAGIWLIIEIAIFSFLGGFIDLISLLVGLNLIFKNSFLSYEILGENVTVFYFIFLLIIRSFLKSFSSYKITTARIRFTNYLREDIIKNTLYSSSYQISKLSKGKLYSILINDITKSSELLDRGIKAIERLIYLIIYLIAFNYIEESLTIPILLALISSLLIVLIKPIEVFKIGKKQVLINESITKIIGDILSGYKEIKSNLLNDFFIDKFNKKINIFFYLFKRSTKIETFYNFLKDLILAIFFVLYYLFFLNQYESEKIIYILIFSYKVASLGSSSFQFAKSFALLIPSYENFVINKNKLGKSIKFKKKDSSLNLRNLQKLDSFEWIVKYSNSTEFSINLKLNSIYVLVGKSGFGKTTLLDMFFGLIGQESCRWKLNCGDNDYFLNSYEAYEFLNNNVAYSTQNPYLFEGTLRENILLNKINNLNEYENSEIERKIYELFSLLELEHLLDRYGNVLDLELGMILESFSKGEIRRIGLIRTWIQDKPIEILDEPTAFLDESVAKKISDIIIKRSKSKFVLLTTHDNKLIKIGNKIFKLTRSDHHEIVKFHNQN